MALSRSVLYDGMLQRPPSPLELRAGPLSMRFDPDIAYLRRIRLGEREVLRGLYVAVRDPVWATVPPEISNLTVEAKSDRFHLRFDVACRQGDIDFGWHGEIVGQPDGTLTYTMDGLAHTTFLRNRIGLCALHPIEECAGQPCLVEKVDGTAQQGAFPARDAIAPHQPFFALRAITHAVTPDVNATLRLQGDTFEMEDQRNWTDASFKTYSTPLELPKPVEIQAGTRIVQSATLSLSGTVPTTQAHAQPAKDMSRIVVGGASTGRMPQIGLQANLSGEPSPATIELLRTLNLHHLRVDLHLAQADWSRPLRSAARQASGLSCALEVGVYLGSSPEQELAALAEVARATPLPIARWLIFHEDESSTPDRWIRQAREVLGAYAAVGGGSYANYAELNRARPTSDDLALACYPVTPQRHTFDNDSMVESLPMQAETVRHVRTYICPADITITPITLRPPAKPGQDPDVVTVDPRQVSLFGAGWTLGSLAALAEALPLSITYYETFGPRGVMAGEASLCIAGTEVPAGSVCPVYHVLADVGAFAGQEVLPTLCENPLAVVALALARGQTRRLLVANVTPTNQQIRLEGVAGDVQIHLLDADTVLQAMTAPAAYRAEAPQSLSIPGGFVPLNLAPFALARVDWLAAPA
ncbi:MAG: hypothetical protein ACYC5M_16185 [Anaerolineae bacterium]